MSRAELLPDPVRYEHVYVHVPFCSRRCSYCDFSIAVRRDVPVSAFNDAIMAEMATRRIAQSPGVRSIYFGGGTPSKLGGAGVAQLVHGIQQALGVEKLPTSKHGLEITIEANPEDITAEAVAAWAGAGINRVSLGVQTFDPAVLEWMHRTHSADAVPAAVQLLKGGGIANISLDLIFALPPEVTRDWSRDLDLALGLEPKHLSLYGLTVEPQTPLGRWAARGGVHEADEERYEREFMMAHDTLGAAGFEHYEVSNFGLPGYRSRHNSSYWSGVPYLALGPAAHGFDGVRRRWNTRAYAEWLERTNRGEDPVEGSELIGEVESIPEQVYLGLRTTDGLHIREDERLKVMEWVDAGWGSLTDSRLVLSAQGWLRLDALAAALTSIRSRS